MPEPVRTGANSECGVAGQLLPDDHDVIFGLNLGCELTRRVAWRRVRLSISYISSTTEERLSGTSMVALCVALLVPAYVATKYQPASD